MERTSSLVIVTLASTLLLTSAPALAAEPADPISSWNEEALAAVKATRASDADTARLVAMVNVAMYDAINGIRSRHGKPHQRGHALVPPAGAPAQGDLHAAAGAAGHAVLVALFAGRAPLLDARLASDLATLHHRPGPVESGLAWGDSVGNAVVALRAHDGSAPIESQPAGNGPGVFRASWSGTQYRELVPFAIDNPADYVGAGPPALGSAAYAVAFAEVKVLGNADVPDQQLLDTYNYWALGAGSVQPPGEWVRIALSVAAAKGTELEGEARLLALVSMALADTVAPTVTTKYIFRHWRPQTAIREAGLDGNEATDADPAWSARAGTVGGSPEYWSGHSSFSGAAAAVLAGFYCQDAFPFRHVSDTAPGGDPRSFASFSAAAEEAGRSRIFGGIHFEFSNQAGLTAGRGVAAEVLANKLLRVAGPTHDGPCPL